MKTDVLVAVLFLAVGGFLIWRDSQVFVPVENPDTELQGKAYIKYWEKLNEAYKKDEYGGATPEETLNLFIEALKAGDLELASKYFVVEKQPEYLEAFDNWKNLNKLESIIVEIENSVNNGSFVDDSYQFFSLDESGNIRLLVELVKNTHTNKWKMYEL